MCPVLSYCLNKSFIYCIELGLGVFFGCRACALPITACIAMPFFFLISPSLHEQGPNSPSMPRACAHFASLPGFCLNSFAEFSRSSCLAARSLLSPLCCVLAVPREPRCERRAACKQGCPPPASCSRGAPGGAAGRKQPPPFLPSSAAVPPAPLRRLAPAVAVRFLPVLAGRTVPRGRARRAAGTRSSP